MSVHLVIIPRNLPMDRKARQIQMRSTVPGQKEDGSTVAVEAPQPHLLAGTLSQPRPHQSPLHVHVGVTLGALWPRGPLGLQGEFEVLEGVGMQ